MGMTTEITFPEAFKRPSAFLPIVMSLIAMAVVIVHIAFSGTAPQEDEGTAAHIWQLMMAAQIPFVAFFLIRWMPIAPRSALLVLAAQIAAALTALLPIFLLKW
jgi:hypothetical protein